MRIHKLTLLVLLVSTFTISVAQTDSSALEVNQDSISAEEAVILAEKEAIKALEEAVEGVEVVEVVEGAEAEEVSDLDSTATEAVLVEVEETHGLILIDDYDEPDYNLTYFDEEDTVELYSDGFEGLGLLDEEVQKYKVFITGENHTYTESNARLWLKMIKYLHENAGVRNVMFEYGYSYGFLVNEYLKTGDTTLFASIDQFAYIEYSDALADLKEYNDSLPEDEKLHFAAIDIERGVYPIAKILSHLLPERFEAHDSISLHVNSLKSLAAYNDYKLDEQDEEEATTGYGFTFKSGATIDLVHKNFLKFENEYKAILGENFDEFRMIIVDNYLARKQWMKYDSEGAIQEYLYRENYMHNRFLEEYKNNPGNWFGQFGRCHTTLTKQNSNSCEWFQFNSLADRIEHTASGEFNNQVMSIAILYEDDRNTGPDRDSLEERFDKFFEDISENSVVLLDITQDSILNEAYGEDFNFIFLNTNTKKGEVYDYLNDYIATSSSDESFKILAGYSKHMIDFSSLSNRVTAWEGNQVEPMEFDNELYAFDISMLGENNGFTTGFNIGWFRKKQKEAEDGTTYELSGFYIKDVSYYNITKGASWLDLMPGIAFGYQNLKLRYPESEGNQLGDNKYTVYTNPAFVIDLSGIIDFNFSRFTLGILAGYNLDVSKKEWLTDGELVTDSPKTSFTGRYQSVRVGLNF
jgi:hypothetical protein